MVRRGVRYHTAPQIAISFPASEPFDSRAFSDPIRDPDHLGEQAGSLDSESYGIPSPQFSMLTKIATHSKLFTLKRFIPLANFAGSTSLARSNCDAKLPYPYLLLPVLVSTAFLCGILNSNPCPDLHARSKNSCLENFPLHSFGYSYHSWNGRPLDIELLQILAPISMPSLAVLSSPLSVRFVLRTVSDILKTDLKGLSSHNPPSQAPTLLEQ